MASLLPLLGLVVCALALAFAWSWRGATRRLEDTAAQLEKQVAKGEDLETALARERKAREKQAGELAGYRKKSDKARRRETRAASQPLGTAARIQDLETELEQVRLERDRAREEGEATLAELVRVRNRPVAVPTPPPEASVPVPSETASSTELDRVSAELSDSEEKRKKLADELAEARSTVARTRKRLENQELLYVSMRGELDAKKDRLRTQEEQLQRLQAFKVALVDEAADPTPGAAIAIDSPVDPDGPADADAQSDHA